MTFDVPAALLLLVPLILSSLLVRRGGTWSLSGMPGHWDRIVEPALRRFLARRNPERRASQFGTCLAIAMILVIALAGPGIEVGQPKLYGNLSGRVIVLDLGAGIDVRDQRLLAQRLVEGSPKVPAAIVAVAADAFDVVPLTTDQVQISRYLQVLEPSLMPEAGRSPHLGLAHGEAILRNAGIVAGQTVLITGGAPPTPPSDAPPSSGLRTIVALGAEASGWSDFAEAFNARLAAPAKLSTIADDLDDSVRQKARAGGAQGHFDLTPLAVAAALALWFFLFRRRATG